MNEQIESPGDRITLISGPGIDGDNRRRQTCMRFKGEEERGEEEEAVEVAFIGKHRHTIRGFCIIWSVLGSHHTANLPLPLNGSHVE